MAGAPRRKIPAGCLKRRRAVMVKFIRGHFGAPISPAQLKRP